MLNPGQEKFKAYILERVQKERRAEAEDLLRESFSKQYDGTFDQAYLNRFMEKMKSFLQPEHAAEVEQTMNEFAAKLNRNKD